MQLKYTIIGRRTQAQIDCVDVEWTRVDGGDFVDTYECPTTIIHMDDVGEGVLVPRRDVLIEKKVAGKRKILKDQINVLSGTPDSVVMQILEEKRERIVDQFKE